MNFKIPLGKNFKLLPINIYFFCNFDCRALHQPTGTIMAVKVSDALYPTLNETVIKVLHGPFNVAGPPHLNLSRHSSEMCPIAPPQCNFLHPGKISLNGHHSRIHQGSITRPENNSCPKVEY